MIIRDIEGLRRRFKESGCEALLRYTMPLKPMERELVGREREIRSLMATFCRAELSNVILLGDAGSGKTAIVQGAMHRDPNRIYLEVDIAAMLEGLVNEDELGTRLSQLFAETASFQDRMREGSEIVLFIDEFHKIMQKSPSAVEDLKPLLADSGTRGIRVVAATTYIEFRQWIAPNQPLVERLERLNVPETDHDMTIAILRGMAERYKISDEVSDAVLESIYTYTNRYIPANAQPRKSIRILDSMLGWHRFEGRPFDRKLLGDVIYESEGVMIDTQVDPTSIKKGLDEVVFAQDLATSTIAKRMQLCLAGLNNPSRPQSTLLFTGSTGVGKSTTCSTPIPVWTSDGAVSWKRAGDVEPGDFVFDRQGRPTKVLGVFPQGEREVYRVTLGDGRVLDVSDNHLWSVFPAKNPRNKGYTIYETKSLIERGLTTRHHDRVGMKYFIPMNEAVQWPEQKLPVKPYALGALIADGSLAGGPAVIISSDDEDVVRRVSDELGAAGYRRSHENNYDWAIYTVMPHDGQKGVRMRQDDVLVGMPTVAHVKSGERRIPSVYMTASIEQRWELVRGLFDCDGNIGSHDGDRFNVSYFTASEGLAQDVQQVLYSLGVGSSITCHERDHEDGRHEVSYRVHVMTSNDGKARFFWLRRRHDVAMQARGVNRQRNKRYDYVGIRSIESLGYKEPMVCFYVDNDEHLYQAGQFVVTHNTAVAKRLAQLLFGDSQQSFIRFDMTEFSQADSVDRFRSEVTNAVWAHPFCVLLLDEIEKANEVVTRLLLPLLDDGRLIDENGRVVTFTNAHVIMTTNAASEIYKTFAQYNKSDTGSGAAFDDNMALIRRSLTETTGDNKFPPELIGRIDAVVPFQPLSENTQARIIRRALEDLRRRIWVQHGVDANFEPRVFDWLVENKLSTDSDSGGARAVLEGIESDITCAVAEFLNAHHDLTHVKVLVEGTLASDDKTRRRSDARIKVVGSDR